MFPGQHWVLLSCQYTADMWYTLKGIPCPLIGYCPAVMSWVLAYKKGDGLSCFKKASVAESAFERERVLERDSKAECVCVCCVCVPHTQPDVQNSEEGEEAPKTCWQTHYNDTLCCGCESVWIIKSPDCEAEQSLEVGKQTANFNVCIFLHAYTVFWWVHALYIYLYMILFTHFRIIKALKVFHLF